MMKPKISKTLKIVPAKNGVTVCEVEDNPSTVAISDEYVFNELADLVVYLRERLDPPSETE